jgi:hypothetical protein
VLALRCSTYYSRFRTDPAGPAREMEGGRVVRGGGFNGSSLYVSLRSNWRVGQQEEDRGFRVARTAR